jgi:hypothetical protein
MWAAKCYNKGRRSFSSLARCANRGCADRHGLRLLQYQHARLFVAASSPLWSFHVQEENIDMPLNGRKMNNIAKKGVVTESIILARLVQLGYA